MRSELIVIKLVKGFIEAECFSNDSNIALFIINHLFLI